MKNRLVILSGPSGAGKSPLVKAFMRFYPDLGKKLMPLVLYNSRAARPGETDGIDYHFRPRQEIEKLKESDNYVVMDVRGDLQALNIEELAQNLENSDVLFEGNPFTGRKLQLLRELDGVNRLSIFLSPVSADEIRFLKSATPVVSIPEFITDVMRRKLLRRTQKQKGILSLRDLENIEMRASSAHRELQGAWQFMHVIPNHDGEDSENWDAFYYPLGDARKALTAFVTLLQGNPSKFAEVWDEDLFL